MLVFAKYICLGKQFNFTCKDMPYFREEIKEEIIRNQINSHTDSNDQNRIFSHPLSICSFINPSRKNLCFSNVVVSLLLNIPLLRSRLMNDENLNEENQLLTLSDMALAGCAPAWGGATLARMLDFLSRGLNQSF